MGKESQLTDSNEKSQELTFDIYGMTCANCALRIERGLGKIPGIKNIRVNLATETAFLQSNDSLTVDKIVQHINSIGYKSNLHSKDNFELAEKNHAKELDHLKFRFFSSSLLSLPLLYSMVTHFSFLNFLPIPDIFLHPWFQFCLATLVQFWIGYPFYISAYKALRNFSTNMDVLVVMGTSSAYFYSIIFSLISGIEKGDIFFLKTALHPQHNHSLYPNLYFETSAILITFLLAGKWMEMLARGLSGSAILALLNLKVENATILKNNEWIEIPSEFIKVGDTILVKPGSKIPTDGLILNGTTTVDESMISGESLPLDKVKGSFVIGGTLNGNGTITIQAEKIGKDTVLASIIKAVENAQLTKAPLQRIADKISNVFIPIVIFIATSNFLIWYFFIEPLQFTNALEKWIAVLVIACPCSLGLATPISLFIASSRSAQKGILFRSAIAMETLAILDTIAFDKTGTLTEGKPYVVSYESFPKLDSNLLLQKIASLETGSSHPLASAVVEYAKDQGISILPFEDLTTTVGSGVHGFVQGENLLIGNLSFILSNKGSISKELLAKAEIWKSQGSSIIYFCSLDGERREAIFALEDKLKPTSKFAIQRIHELGIKTILLTGDHELRAKKITTEVGISEYYSSLNPIAKSEWILSEKSLGKKIAMVGDGINDAPALANADLGIAMGNGTDVAIESAGLVIVKGDLSKLVDSIFISRATVRNIRQNFFWAIFYNFLGIPLACLGLLSPTISGIAMSFSSISVVLNALRLKSDRISKSSSNQI